MLIIEEGLSMLVKVTSWQNVQGGGQIEWKRWWRDCWAAATQISDSGTPRILHPTYFRATSETVL